MYETQGFWWPRPEKQDRLRKAASYCWCALKIWRGKWSKNCCRCLRKDAHKKITFLVAKTLHHWCWRETSATAGANTELSASDVDKKMCWPAPCQSSMPQLTPNVDSLSELFGRSGLRNLGKDAEAVLGGRHNSWRLNYLVRTYCTPFMWKYMNLFDSAWNRQNFLMISTWD